MMGGLCAYALLQQATTALTAAKPDRVMEYFLELGCLNALIIGGPPDAREYPNNSRSYRIVIVVPQRCDGRRSAVGSL
jgi:hypothetical protein